MASKQGGEVPGQRALNKSTSDTSNKGVAGALRKLFKFSSQKSNDGKAPPAPDALRQDAAALGLGGQGGPGGAGGGGSAGGRQVTVVHSSSLKASHHAEPTSVLDYDERSSAATSSIMDGRSSAAIGSDRSSVMTDRSSSLERSSAASSSHLHTSASHPHQPRLQQLPEYPEDTDEGDAAAGQGQRSGGGSRLTSYLKNIMKGGAGTGQRGGPASGPPSQHQAAPVQQPQSPQAVSKQGHHGSPVSSPSKEVAQAGKASAGAAQFQVQGGGRPEVQQLQQQYLSRSGCDSPNASMGPPGVTVPPGSPGLTPPSPQALQRLETDSNLLAVCNDLPPAMDRPQWRVEDYTLLQKMHAGYASAVYKAICRLSGATVALKVYQPAKLHEISQYQLYREARLHAQMSHPNIIKLYAAFRHGQSVVLVQEYADGGDLLQLLMRHGTRLSERRAVSLVLQPLLRALYYLHARNIVHRDIKLENILFQGKELTLKLADFGLCLNLREERSVTRAGTLDYMAPEVLRCPQKHKPNDNKERTDLAYGVAVDVWAFGVVAYELLNGCPPFTCHDKKETERRINSGLLPEFVVDVSEMAEDFVYACFLQKAEERPTVWELLRDPWLKAVVRTSASNLLEGLLPPPSAQPSAGASPAHQHSPAAQHQLLHSASQGQVHQQARSPATPSSTSQLASTPLSATPASAAATPSTYATPGTPTASHKSATHHQQFHLPGAEAHVQSPSTHATPSSNRMSGLVGEQGKEQAAGEGGASRRVTEDRDHEKEKRRLTAPMDLKSLLDSNQSLGKQAAQVAGPAASLTQSSTQQIAAQATHGLATTLLSNGEPLRATHLVAGNTSGLSPTGPQHSSPQAMQSAAAAELQQMALHGPGGKKIAHPFMVEGNSPPESNEAVKSGAAGSGAPAVVHQEPPTPREAAAPSTSTSTTPTRASMREQAAGSSGGSGARAAGASPRTPASPAAPSSTLAPTRMSPRSGLNSGMGKGTAEAATPVASPGPSPAQRGLKKTSSLPSSNGPTPSSPSTKQQQVRAAGGSAASATQLGSGGQPSAVAAAVAAVSRVVGPSQVQPTGGLESETSTEAVVRPSGASLTASPGGPTRGRALDKSFSQPETGRAADVLRHMFRSQAVSRRPGGGSSSGPATGAASGMGASGAAGAGGAAAAAAAARESYHPGANAPALAEALKDGEVASLLGELWREKDRERRDTKERERQARRTSSGLNGPSGNLGSSSNFNSSNFGSSTEDAGHVPTIIVPSAAVMSAAAAMAQAQVPPFGRHSAGSVLMGATYGSVTVSGRASGTFASCFPTPATSMVTANSGASSMCGPGSSASDPHMQGQGSNAGNGGGTLRDLLESLQRQRLAREAANAAVTASSSAATPGSGSATTSAPAVCASACVATHGGAAAAAAASLSSPRSGGSRKQQQQQGAAAGRSSNSAIRWSSVPEEILAEASSSLGSLPSSTLQQLLPAAASNSSVTGVGEAGGSSGGRWAASPSPRTSRSGPSSKGPGSGGAVPAATAAPAGRGGRRGTREQEGRLGLEDDAGAIVAEGEEGGAAEEAVAASQQLQQPKGRSMAAAVAVAAAKKLGLAGPSTGPAAAAAAAAGGKVEVEEVDAEDELALLGDMSKNRKLGKSFSNPTKRTPTTDLVKRHWS